LGTVTATVNREVEAVIRMIVVSDDAPKIGLCGTADLEAQRLDGRFVHTQDTGLQTPTSHQVDQRPDALGQTGHPTGLRAASDAESVAREDILLPIVGQVVRKTAGRQVGPEPGARVSVDQSRRPASCRHGRFARLFIFDDHLLKMLDHVDRRRHVFQLFAGLLEETLGRRIVTQVIRDVVLVQLVSNFLSRQNVGKHAATAPVAGATRLGLLIVPFRFRLRRLGLHFLRV